MTVTAGRLSTFRPSQLPGCGSQTLLASADSWINQASPDTNYGTDTVLRVAAQNGAHARTLVRFTLPAAPSGCTLAAATLRLHNTTATTGRTISVYRAAATWTESGVTWTNAPAQTGTTVDLAAATGWMQWTVTAHVQSFYSSGNNGFLVRDSSESGGNRREQPFASRESTQKPELVLQWQ